MSERWFDPEDLEQLARPTMDRAIEALDRGDVAAARRLCGEMRSEWRYLHDLMAESMLGLLTFIHSRLGDEGIENAWRETFERGWRRDTGAIVDRDRRDIVVALAATWRAHSVSGLGPVPARFSIDEDDEKFTFTLNPCGSGQRLYRRGLYEGPDAYGVTDGAHDWTYDRSKFPLYCTHCSFMNEILPIEWYGAPLYPSEAPADFDRDPCVWYWYKDPAAIPAVHWSRYGKEKGQA